MELIDTHCHLYLKEFQEDRTDIIQRAVSEGVKKFYLPSIDSSYFQDLLKMEMEFPGQCLAMAGLHPCSVKNNYRWELTFFEAYLSQRKFAAVGEIGLDFYWDRSFESEQYEAFRIQIDYALQHDLPIVIHSRDSMEETIRVVQEKQKGNLRGIFHCFNDGPDAAKKIIDLGFFLGIGGVITYKNSKLPETLRSVGTEWLVLETDAPYLPPSPYRGKRNESSYLPFILARLAEVKEKTTEEMAEITTTNAIKIFGN